MPSTFHSLARAIHVFGHVTGRLALRSAAHTFTSSTAHRSFRAHTGIDHDGQLALGSEHQLAQSELIRSSCGFRCPSVHVYIRPVLTGAGVLTGASPEHAPRSLPARRRDQRRRVSLEPWRSGCIVANGSSNCFTWNTTRASSALVLHWLPPVSLCYLYVCL